MSALLKAEQVSKAFHNGTGEVTVLHEVSLDLAPGAFVALTGPSGSGKTTLLTLLGCLAQPTRGRILFDGKDTTALSRAALAHERLTTIGFVFQDYNLIPTLSALENVEYVLWLQGKASRAQRSEAARVLTRVGLGPYLHRRPNRLSRGQQQRVAICRAIVHRPKLVLGDEITASLDHKTGLELMAFLEELNSQEGITVLYATHDPVMMALAKRRIQLEDGRVVGSVNALEEASARISTRVSLTS